MAPPNTYIGARRSEVCTMWRWLDAMVGTEHEPSISRVELIGTTHVLIERHKGLCAVTFVEVRVALLRGTVCVRGTQLVVQRMSAHDVVISGMIEHVAWDGARDA